MAREKERRSQTGIYHIMLCGIDRRNIFLEDEDKDKDKDKEKYIHLYT